MSKVVSAVTDFIGGVEKVVDAIAALPPGDVRNEIGLIVTVATTLGVLHLTNAPAAVDALTGLVVALAAAGVAVERAVKALKPPVNKPTTTVVK